MNLLTVNHCKNTAELENYDKISWQPFFQNDYMPQYSWNPAKVGVKDQSIDQSIKSK